MELVALKFFLYIIIVLSAAFHEYAHGFMAYRLGDSTAKDAGRLTLNPLAHLDLMGTVVIPLFLLFTGGIFIGWAKPVPYNPYNLRDPKYGSLKVGIAGPFVNFLIALILGLLFRFSTILPFQNEIFIQFLGLIIYINIFLALFNLIPIPPLDGSKILTDLLPQLRRSFETFGLFGIFFAILFAFYVLPPLARFLFLAITGVNPFF